LRTHTVNKAACRNTSFVQRQTQSDATSERSSNGPLCRRRDRFGSCLQFLRPIGRATGTDQSRGRVAINKHNNRYLNELVGEVISLYVYLDVSLIFEMAIDWRSLWGVRRKAFHAVQMIVCYAI